MTPFGYVIGVVLAAMLGTGVVVLVNGLRPARADLGDVLRQLNASPQQETHANAVSGTLRGLAAKLAVPRTELALLERTVEGYIALKVACVLLGLALPLLLSGLLWSAKVSVPIYIPAGGSLVGAVIFFFVVDADIRYKARAARREWRYAICSYLDLVALERAAGRGAVAALERPAEIGSGWVFTRIRTAMTQARYEQRAPWDALRDVGDELGLPVLGDVGTVLQMSGESGSEVYATLRSLAESVRNDIVTQEQTRANADTTVLSIPSTALVIVLFAMGAYPMLARLLA